MNEVVETQKQIAVTPVDLLRMALDNGADLDRLERLMDLQAKWEAGQSRKQYVEAMALFKSVPLTIHKDKSVRFTTSKGVTAYEHATLAEVVDTVVPEMAKCGLTHRWNIEQRDSLIIVTCVITHSAGHAESVQMIAKADDSGGKNAIQQIASTCTYLQRYTLMSACGLAARDMDDDDGRGSEPEKEVPRSGERDRLWNVIKPFADKGVEALKAAWQKGEWITDKEGKELAAQAIKDRELIGDWLAKLKEIAAKADAKAQETLSA